VACLSAIMSTARRTFAEIRFFGASGAAVAGMVFCIAASGACLPWQTTHLKRHM
jgi:hypothetical protein